MRLSKEQKREIYTPIIQEYLQDEIVSLTKLAKKYDVSYPSIRKYAIEMGLSLKKEMRPPRKITEEEILKIIEEYETNLSESANSLSKKYGVTYPTISKWLKRSGVKKRRAKDAALQNRVEEAAKDYVSSDINALEAAKKHKVGKNTLLRYLKNNNLIKRPIVIQQGITYDKRYFKDINTTEKAYWFGFIYADGCVSYDEERKTGSLRIEIQERDIELLENFLVCISSNKLIKKRQRIMPSGTIVKMCSITINCIDMAKDLIKHGCVPNKTYVGKIPRNIFNGNKKLEASFLLGYLDGDGYISKCKKSVSCISYVIHNHNVMNFVLRTIISVSGVIPQVRYEQDKIGGAYRLRIMNKTDFLVFLKIIYENSKIHMDRKHKRYLDHIASRPETSSLKSQDDKSGIKRGGS